MLRLDRGHIQGTYMPKHEPNLFFQRLPEFSSGPTNFVHEVHVGIDSASGGFTGVPKEWKALLQGSNINAADVTQHPQEVLEVLEFYANSMGLDISQEATPSPSARDQYSPSQLSSSNGFSFPDDENSPFLKSIDNQSPASGAAANGSFIPVRKSSRVLSSYSILITVLANGYPKHRFLYQPTTCTTSGTVRELFKIHTRVFAAHIPGTIR